MKAFKVLCLFILALINPVFAMLFFIFPKMQNIFNPMVFLVLLGSFVPGLVFFIYKNSNPNPDFWFRFLNSGLFLTILAFVVPALLIVITNAVRKKSKENKVRNFTQHP